MKEQKQDPEKKLTLPACPSCQTKRWVTGEWTDGVLGMKVVCSKCGKMLQKIEGVRVVWER